MSHLKQRKIVLASIVVLSGILVWWSISGDSESDIKANSTLNKDITKNEVRDTLAKKIEIPVAKQPATMADNATSYVVKNDKKVDNEKDTQDGDLPSTKIESRKDWLQEFNNEPLDLEWSANAQIAIETNLEEFLNKNDAWINEIECRAQTCKLSISTIENRPNPQSMVSPAMRKLSSDIEGIGEPDLKSIDNINGQFTFVVTIKRNMS